MKKSNMLLVILSIIFILISILVLNELTYNLDQYIYQFLIQFKNKWLTSFFKSITELANVKCCIFVVFLSIVVLRDRKGFLVLMTAVDTGFLNLLLKSIFQRQRPNILQLVPVTYYSYPSGHAMISTGIYGSFIYLSWKYVKNKKMRYLVTSFFGIVILLIGISRVYLGVHHATDIVAGYTVSLFYLILLDKVIQKWGDKDVSANRK